MKKRIKTLIHDYRRALCSGFALAMCSLILGVCSSCGNKSELYDEIIESKSELLYDDSQPVSTVEASTEVYLTEAEELGETMVVHLCGAVNNPGVYEFAIDSRVYDGIVKAGGFAEDACEDALNLAMPLTDGSRVYVPTVDEVTNEDGNIDTSKGKQYIQNGNSASVGSPDAGGDLVNINTAGVERLTTLTGIGESRAKSIIAYREEHGAFKRIEDIMNVTGIKEASFAKIKDSITVN